MSEEEPTHLTPAEAGAFVAQWAETRPIEFAELVRRLEVADTQSVSLLRQARGRLAMDRWLQQKQPQKSPGFARIGMIVGAFVLGAILMLVAQSYFAPRHEPPAVTVTTSGPEQTTPSNPPPSTPVPRATQLLSDGSQLGTAIANITKGDAPPVGLSATSGSAIPMALVPNNAPTQRKKVDLTADLKQPMPDDLFLEVITEKAVYVRHGDITYDDAAAKRIQESEVTLPLEGMVAEVLRREPAARDKPASVTLRIGRASTEVPLDWSLAILSSSIGSSTEPGVEYYESLAAPILQKIHELPELFTSSPAHPASKL